VFSIQTEKKAYYPVTGKFEIKQQQGGSFIPMSFICLRHAQGGDGDGGKSHPQASLEAATLIQTQ